jgi:hypothetical protein
MLTVNIKSYDFSCISEILGNNAKKIQPVFPEMTPFDAEIVGGLYHVELANDVSPQQAVEILEEDNRVFFAYNGYRFNDLLGVDNES